MKMKRRLLTTRPNTRSALAVRSSSTSTFASLTLVAESVEVADAEEPVAVANAVDSVEIVLRVTAANAPSVLSALKADSVVANAVPTVATGVLAAPVEHLPHAVDRPSVLLLKSTMRRISQHWVRLERRLRRLLSPPPGLCRRHIQDPPPTLILSTPSWQIVE